MSARRTLSADETERLGEALAEFLRTGDVIALEGPLGSGKTRFVTGLARGLHCKARVRSPTFALVHHYSGRVPLAHLDLYRLAPGDTEGLGIEELAERAALAVEWGEKLPASWRADALALAFSLGEAPDERLIEASAKGERGEELLRAWDSRRTHGTSGSPA
jgi:tRNA threonylcarbamoyladenosine biosynthesis protein TsaE